MVTPKQQVMLILHAGHENPERMPTLWGDGVVGDFVGRLVNDDGEWRAEEDLQAKHLKIADVFLFEHAAAGIGDEDILTGKCNLRQG